MARTSTLARFEISGEILSEDTVALLTLPECRLPGVTSDPQEFAAAWDLLRELWQQIRQEVATYDTEHLRQRWILPVLQMLGHEPRYLRSHTPYAQNRTIPLTHRANDIPIWLIEYGVSPDEKNQTVRRGRSPHEVFQEYLDLTADDWGILCNGSSIRLLHDYHKTLTRNYVEADLESIFEALDVDAFRAVWRIFHARQFVSNDQGERPLEKLRDYSREEGVEIGKELRKQVLEAIRILGNGFLAADRSGELLAELQQDPEAPMRFYQAVLRVVYRLLFLLYIENKPGWTPAANPIWASSYSITRLREHAQDAGAARTDGEDYWEGLRVVFRIIREGSKFFEIQAYGGELFDDQRLGLLADAALRNTDLLRAIYLLTVFERGGQPYRVNFRTMSIDALGNVYEGLLDVAPVITSDGVFTFGEGTERKLTGSYYTPPELVAELINSALVPVIEDRLLNVHTREEQERSLLAIKVVDPACGSGAFLIQALDKLAERLCAIRKEGEEPSELDIREARRDVVTHCIHGVDLNPMAVELCKFTLWLHVAHPKLPLSYLEPLVKCGNSLVGVPLTGQVELARRKAKDEAERLYRLGDTVGSLKARYVGWPECVPVDAFDPVCTDRKEIAREIKKRQREQVKGPQFSLDAALRQRAEHLARSYKKVLEFGEYDIASVRAKETRFHGYLESTEYRHTRLLADLWCAAFFWPQDALNGILPTQEWLIRAQANPEGLPTALVEEMGAIVERVNPFHWELEFPDVFQQGGFDCVLGNPPWEMLQLEEQEYFASRAPEIAHLPGDARKKAIEDLACTNSDLYANFEVAKHAAAATAKFLHHSGRFPLTAVGKMNTYALFAETGRNVLNSSGRAGVVVPTGIATDDTTKAFFGDLVANDTLVSIQGYENEGNIFPGVHHAFKFAALTLGETEKNGGAKLVFLCRQIQDAHDPVRGFTLSAKDFDLLNPNTRTCPVFRTRADAELTKVIYKRVPVLIDEVNCVNSWRVAFRQGLFNMTSDSNLFLDKRAADRLPLYEAKMIYHFDHRYATYEGATEANLAEGSLPQPAPEQKADPNFTVLPRYWVDDWDVLGKVAKVPPRLIACCREEKEKAACNIISEWLVGYILNHGDYGEKDCAKLGEALKQNVGAFLLHTIGADLSPYLKNQTSFRGLEQQYPLTEHDIAIIRENAVHEDWLGMGCALARAHCPKWFLGFRDITSSVVERTAIFSLLPLAGVGHTMPLAFLDPERSAARETACFLANVCALTFDYSTRQKIGGTHLTYSYLKQLPVLPPLAYTRDDKEYITSRVLELVYTAWDMKPFAEELGYDGPPFTWNEERRALLRAELDAYYARLYGLTRKQLRYILDPNGLSDRELEDILAPCEDPTCAGPHLLPEYPTATFPGETFRVLKQNEERAFGEYRTRRLVLDAWARLEAEYGPAKPVNYREMLAAAQVDAAKQAAVKLASSEPREREELVLVPPDPPQKKLPLK